MSIIIERWNKQRLRLDPRFGLVQDAGDALVARLVEAQREYDVMDDRIDDQDMYLAEIAAERDRLRTALEDLVDDDKCRYDHDDYCQEHYFAKPCAMERARAALGSTTEPEETRPDQVIACSECDVLANPQIMADLRGWSFTSETLWLCPVHAIREAQ